MFCMKVPAMPYGYRRGMGGVRTGQSDRRRAIAVHGEDWLVKKREQNRDARRKYYHKYKELT